MSQLLTSQDTGEVVLPCELVLAVSPAELTASNVREFDEALRIKLNEIASIRFELGNVPLFRRFIGTAKKAEELIGQAVDRLELGAEAAEAIRTLRMLGEDLREERLAVTRKVDSLINNERRKIEDAANSRISEAVKEIFRDRLKGHPASIFADYSRVAMAAKGRKTIESYSAAVQAEEIKIVAEYRDKARVIYGCLEVIDAANREELFADWRDLTYRSTPESIQLIVDSRLAAATSSEALRKVQQRQSEAADQAVIDRSADLLVEAMSDVDYAAAEGDDFRLGEWKRKHWARCTKGMTGSDMQQLDKYLLDAVAKLKAAIDSKAAANPQLPLPMAKTETVSRRELPELVKVLTVKFSIPDGIDVGEFYGRLGEWLSRYNTFNNCGAEILDAEED